MDRHLHRKIRLLEAYALVTMPLLVILSVAAFRQTQSPNFDEINVHRINVREPDGTLRLTISNKATLPPNIIGGKAYPLRDGGAEEAAGFIFFNDEGNEDGGMTWAGKSTATGHAASAGLSFDQYNQDETVTLSYGDENGKREAGLAVVDRPNESIQILADSLMAIRSLPNGPEKTRRMQAFRAAAVKRGELGAPRLFAGKLPDESSVVVLSDRHGKPRLRLAVDSTGAPTLEFLDQNGHVTYALPQTQH